MRRIFQYLGAGTHRDLDESKDESERITLMGSISKIGIRYDEVKRLGLRSLTRDGHLVSVPRE